MGGNYTFTQVEKQLNRLIPKHKGNVDVSYVFNRGTFGMQYQYVDQRNDAFYDSTIWATQAVDLSAYQVVNSSILPNYSDKSKFDQIDANLGVVLETNISFSSAICSGYLGI